MVSETTPMVLAKGRNPMVALNQSGQLEVLDARKAAGVDDRIQQAAQTVLPGLDRLLLDRHPQARGVVAAGRPALTAVMTLSGWSPGQVAHRSGRVLTEVFRITGGHSILHRVARSPVVR